MRTPLEKLLSILDTGGNSMLRRKRIISSFDREVVHLWEGLLAFNVKVALSCPTLCDPMDYIVQEILEARILEWVAFPFSRGSPQPRH